jgi:phosphoserine phosphatase
VSLAVERGVDLAFQRERLTRRSKRLIVMDMDSTLIRIEVIDELARAYGVYDEVAAITAKAMLGNMPYEESLIERVALLRGMPLAAVMQIAGNPPMMPGAPELLRALRALGMKTAVISGGFSFAADALKARFGIDYAYSNTLEVKDGALTGRVLEPIVGPQRKADLLDALAQREGIPLEQSVAVGDGANDLLMIEKAGLGIAFHAKPKLRGRRHEPDQRRARSHPVPARPASARREGAPGRLTCRQRLLAVTRVAERASPEIDTVKRHGGIGV